MPVMKAAEPPLHLAGVFGRAPTIVTALVEAGASINALDEKGRTPLQTAKTFSNTPAMVNALREASKDAPPASGEETDSDRQLVEVSCEEWNTPSFFVRANSVDVSRCLTEGAKVSARNQTGETPLHLAAQRSEHPAVVAALVAAGARMSARDERGTTPLHTAAAKSTVPEVVDALLDAGADPAAKDEIGKTPGDYVKANPALRGSSLYRMVAQVSCEDWNTQAFFERADTADVTRCLSSGAKVDTRDDTGATPLHLAASNSAVPAVIEVLLDAGADAAAKDAQGRLPWDHARSNPALKGTDIYWQLNDARFN